MLLAVDEFWFCNSLFLFLKISELSKRCLLLLLETVISLAAGFESLAFELAKVSPVESLEGWEIPTYKKKPNIVIR